MSKGSNIPSPFFVCLSGDSEDMDCYSNHHCDKVAQVNEEAGEWEERGAESQV